jgi:lipid-binding SYLF domain-containing protein
MKTLTILVISLCCATSAFAQEKEDNRLKESYTVLKEILGMPDKGIPRDLLDKAECVALYPSVKKAAFHSRRQLRSGRYHLSKRRGLYRALERSRDVCLGGRQLRLADRR